MKIFVSIYLFSYLLLKWTKDRHDREQYYCPKSPPMTMDQDECINGDAEPGGDDDSPPEGADLGTVMHNPVEAATSGDLHHHN